MRDQDTQKLNSIRNKHEGGRAFIIATGRSLLELDPVQFARLKDEPVTIGMNFLARWRKMPFVPQYFVACESDAFPTVDGTTEHLSFPGGKFFTYDKPSEYMLRGKGWTWVARDHQAFIQQDRVPAWVDDRGAPFAPFTSSSTPILGTVVWDAATQLALWMGCREVYVLGMDADKRGYVFYSEAEKEGVSDGRVSHVVDIASCIERELGKRGISFVNLTPGGNLTIPRRDLKDVLDGESTKPPVVPVAPAIQIPGFSVFDEDGFLKDGVETTTTAGAQVAVEVSEQEFQQVQALGDILTGTEPVTVPQEPTEEEKEEQVLVRKRQAKRQKKPKVLKAAGAKSTVKHTNPEALG